MIKTETVNINGQLFIHTYSDDGVMIERDGIEYDEAYDPIDTGRVYTETSHIIETTIEELKEKYTEVVQKYNYAEARAERLERIKNRIIELRDKATLQTTKAIYNAILQLFEED